MTQTEHTTITAVAATAPAVMPAHAKSPMMSRRLSRHEFNAYLYELYGCTGQNNVKPHYVWGGDEDDYDYHIEVFLNSPAGGTMVALHFGPRMDWVDVAVYAEEAA